MAKASKRKRASGAPQTETPYLSAGERRAKGKALRGTASRESVLEPYAGKSLHPHHGQRVVVGQRIMQTASDVFLGWMRGQDGRDYYIRQLRDMKLSAIIEEWDTGLLRQYARMCAHALARAHARSGDAAMISGYMGAGQTFDDAIGEFAVEYSDQNRSDYGTFVRAVRDKRVEALVEN